MLCVCGGMYDEKEEHGRKGYPPMWRLARAAAMAHPSPPRFRGTISAASTVPVLMHVCTCVRTQHGANAPGEGRTEDGPEAADGEGAEEPSRLRQHLAEVGVEEEERNG